MNKNNQWFFKIFLAGLSLLVWIPLLFMLTSSLMGGNELVKNFQGVLSTSPKYVTAQLFPQYPTLSSYISVLMDRPEFFVFFKNSSIITLFSILGQFFVSVPAAWWFAKCSKKRGNKLLLCYTILMIMPFQVTMLSSYLILSKLHLLDTLWCIILPLVFSTFPIVIMTESFAAIPENIIEAAEIDRASPFKIFWEIGVPEAKSGIIAAFTLTFLESWNLVEQPLVFLKNPAKWPLSMFSPTLTPETIGIYFAVAVLTLIPPVLVFLMGQSSLESSVRIIEKEEI